MWCPIEATQADLQAATPAPQWSVSEHGGHFFHGQLQAVRAPRPRLSGRAWDSLNLDPRAHRGGAMLATNDAHMHALQRSLHMWIRNAAPQRRMVRTDGPVHQPLGGRE